MERSAGAHLTLSGAPFSHNAMLWGRSLLHSLHFSLSFFRWLKVCMLMNTEYSPSDVICLRSSYWLQCVCTHPSGRRWLWWLIGITLALPSHAQAEYMKCVCACVSSVITIKWFCPQRTLKGGHQRKVARHLWFWQRYKAEQYQQNEGRSHKSSYEEKR